MLGVTKRALAMIAIAGTLPFLCAPSCQKDRDPAPPPDAPAAVAGVWAGSWRSDDGVTGGNISVDLTQAGAVVAGTASMDRSCFSGDWPTSGAVGPDTLYLFFAFAVRIDCDLVDPDTFVGRYVFFAGLPNCIGDQGTVVLERQ